MDRSNFGFCVALLVLMLNVGSSHADEGEGGCFSAIYSFGDSLADTGNFLISRPNNEVGHSPYGETFFHSPTGRFSDGRLIVDFLAEASGMPLLQPFLGKGSYEGGINFAVAGATALDPAYLISRNVPPVTPLSLGVQIDWFLQYRKRLCANYKGNCDDHFNKALFLFGEIGGNDFNYQFLANKPIEQVSEFVDPVMNAIKKALKTLIDQGSAKKIFVQNNLPIGCSPSYLTSHPQEPRDSLGCMPRFNDFASSANAKLQQIISDLQNQYPQTLFVFADYYSAALALIKSQKNFGIRNTFNACCGQSGTPYNVNLEAFCGSNIMGVSVCENPSEFINWDGLHLTENAYHAITHMFLESLTTPNFRTSLCPSSSSSFNQSFFLHESPR